jgi:cell division transport system ATP-binding protein
MIVATHNQAIVDRMRRRVVRLVNGRIARDDEHGRYHVGLG